METEAEEAAMVAAVKMEMCLEGLKACIQRDFSDRVYVSYGLFPYAFPMGSKVVCEVDVTMHEDKLSCKENTVEFVVQVLAKHDHVIRGQHMDTRSAETVGPKENNEDFIVNLADLNQLQAVDMNYMLSKKEEKGLSEDHMPFKLISFVDVTKLSPGMVLGEASYGALVRNLSELDSGSLEEKILEAIELLIEEKGRDPYALAFIKSTGTQLNFKMEFPSIDIRHPNVLPTLGLYNSDEISYQILPKTSYTLENILHFSPAALKSDWKMRFLIYQILSALVYSHEKGISHGNLTPSNILLTDTYWCLLDGFCESSLQDTEQTVKLSNSHSYHKSNFCTEVCPCRTLFSDLKLLAMDWESDFRNWLEGKLSNFEYLMTLNRLAGRRWGDFTFHTVMPWVIDFSVKPDETSDVGWRDLKKSKWHLAKGDEQLDFTYATSEMPHHVSDECLSELAVCSYKARRLPLNILRRAVRSVYEPNEYPASMQRLYQWTPDECIPEFYNDPQIFYSIHEGMSNLAVPSWAGNPEEFIHLHSEALESDKVSMNLHHWIDLTFGYKLSGEAAIAAKNVALSNTTSSSLRSSGRRQLFSQPHPMRKLYKKRLDDSRNVISNSEAQGMEGSHNVSNNEVIQACSQSSLILDCERMPSTLEDLEEILLFTESARHLSPCYSPLAGVATKNSTSNSQKKLQRSVDNATVEMLSEAFVSSDHSFNFLETFEDGKENTFEDFLFWENKLCNRSSSSEALAKDVFSLGCIMAELYLQRPLFDHVSLMFYNKYGVLPGCIKKLPPCVRYFTQLALERDWTRRPTAKDLFESPFFPSTVRSAYQFLAPLYLYGSRSSRLKYAAKLAKRVMSLMGPVAAEMCVPSCLPLIMAPSISDVEDAVQLLKEFLGILKRQAAKALLLPAIQKALQSNEPAHLKISLLQISFMQDLWKYFGINVCLEKIHPLVISNLATGTQKSLVSAASVLLVCSCEELGMPMIIHQTILPLISYFGRGLTLEALETLVRIGENLGEKFIVRQVFPLLKSMIHSLLEFSTTEKSEPYHSWHNLAIIDTLMVLDAFTRILPNSVVLTELVQEQNNVYVRILAQNSLSQNSVQHAAKALLAVCHYIGPENTSLYVLPQIKNLLDEFAFSEEADILLRDRAQLATSSKSSSSESVDETCAIARIDIVFLLYPGLAALIGIEKLRQCCSTWLLLEQILFRKHNWKWGSNPEVLHNSSDINLLGSSGKDALPDYNPAKLLLKGVGWSIPQSQSTKGRENTIARNGFQASDRCLDPWFWLPSSSDCWDGPEVLNRLGGIKDDNPWRLKASILHSVRVHPGALRAIATEENESIAFSAGTGQRMSGIVCKWHLSTLECELSYLGHDEVVNGISILPRYERVASCDGTIHVWNSQTGKCISVFSESLDTPSSIGMPSNSGEITHGGTGLSTPGILSAGFHGSLYSCMQYLEAEGKLVAGTGNGYLRFIDLNSGKPLHLWRCELLETTFTSLISAICCSGLSKGAMSSSWIATGFSSGHCRLLDLRSGTISAHWRAHDGFITKLAALDDHLMISSSLDKTLRLWDLRRGSPQQFQIFKGHFDGVSSFSIWGHDMLSSSGNKIGVSSLFRSYEQNQEHRIIPKSLHTIDRGAKNMSSISSVCVLPFSRIFLLGTEDGYLKLCC